MHSNLAHGHAQKLLYPCTEFHLGSTKAIVISKVVSPPTPDNHVTFGMQLPLALQSPLIFFLSYGSWKAGHSEY